MHASDSEPLQITTPLTLGDSTLQNRVVLAPMTRSRANPDGTANALIQEYYTQRATAGLLITEGISPSAEGIGYISIPGLYTQAHAKSWQPITAAVQAEGAVIFAQLMHGGRIGHATLSGLATVSPSALRPEGQTYLPQGMAPYETPEVLTLEGIKKTIEAFVHAGHTALQAGFNGIEIHGANGYLPNQFLAESTNHRTDAYGGSIENRARFTLELAAALTEALGPDRVAIRLSPTGTNNGIEVQDPLATYSYLIAELNKLPMAYLHLMEGTKIEQQPAHYPKEIAQTFRPLWHKTLIASGGMTLAKAETLLAKGTAELISFGIDFVANPDLVYRLVHKIPLARPDKATLYSGGAKGYTDYPAYAESEAV